MLHRHGSYQRNAKPKGTEKLAIEVYLCVVCRHSVSVLPVNHLSYRPLEVDRLQAHFDLQAEGSSGLDPPPDVIEAGCLQRAWKRFLTRVNCLKEAFGQILSAELHSPEQLWKELRRAVGSAEKMLRFLAKSCKRSLLGDYACLRPAA